MSRRYVSVAAPKTWSFEPTGRLVHLRWAVAEISIAIDTPSAGLEAAERALRIFAQRAATLLEVMETDSEALADACYAAGLAIAEARSSLTHSQLLRVERARALHQARRKLHRGLVMVAEALAREGGARAPVSGLESPELRSLLALRQMFSAFRGGLISAGEQRARLSWALEVATGELTVLLANPAFGQLPLEARDTIHDVLRRVQVWSSKEPEPVLGRSLYREVMMLPAIAGELSTHPLLLEHDEQSLSELAALLAHEPVGPILEHEVLSHLSELRGMDTELDRLELNVIYGTSGALGSLSLRVNDLRVRLSRPPRQAAAWS
jgi:hypothetical protein